MVCFKQVMVMMAWRKNPMHFILVMNYYCYFLLTSQKYQFLVFAVVIKALLIVVMLTFMVMAVIVTELLALPLLP